MYIRMYIEETLVGWSAYVSATGDVTVWIVDMTAKIQLRPGALPPASPARLLGIAEDLVSHLAQQVLRYGGI